MKLIIVCIIAGMGAGLGTGFAGMSAAAVISPMLITFLEMDPYEAIGIALASDVLASAVSAYTYGKNKNIDLKNSKSLFISVIIFTGIGAFISHLMPTTTIGNLSVFGSFFLGLNFLYKSTQVNPKKITYNLNVKAMKLLPILCGSIIGFICGFIGAGGGMMMLLLLTTVLGYELKIAVGTSVFIMTFTALYGATSHFVLSNIFPDFTTLILCILSTLFFARVGACYANIANEQQLNRSVGLILTILGIVMISVNYL
ncbi:MAG: sulfite exporter TauE/SafE family protein [Erysipelotrichaceae bacterium]